MSNGLDVLLNAANKSSGNEDTVSNNDKLDVIKALMFICLQFDMNYKLSADEKLINHTIDMVLDKVRFGFEDRLLESMEDTELNREVIDCYYACKIVANSTFNNGVLCDNLLSNMQSMFDKMNHRPEYKSESNGGYPFIRTNEGFPYPYSEVYVALALSADKLREKLRWVESFDEDDDMEGILWRISETGANMLKTEWFVNYCFRMHILSVNLLLFKFKTGRIYLPNKRELQTLTMKVNSYEYKNRESELTDYIYEHTHDLNYTMMIIGYPEYKEEKEESDNEIQIDDVVNLVVDRLNQHCREMSAEDKYFYVSLTLDKIGNSVRDRINGQNA